MQVVDKWEVVEMGGGESALSLSLSDTDKVLRNPAAVYLLSLSSPLSRKTMASFLGRVAAMVGQSSLELFQWGALRRPHIQAVVSTLSASGLAPATINTYIAALKGVALEAWSLKLMSAEDFQQIKAVKSVRGKRIPKGRALNYSEISALYSVCDADKSSTGIRDAAMIALLLGCGLRRAEVVSMDIENIDKVDLSFKIIGKGNKQREVFIPPSSWERLQKWIHIKNTTTGPVFSRIRKEDKITESRLTNQAVYHILRERQIESGIQPFTPHDMRRTFASMLLANGEDIITVKDAMGHESVLTTQKYDRRGVERLRQASQRLRI